MNIALVYNISMKPIVKWAGGKTQLLDELLPLIPEFNTYYEVFFGGGALYFALEPQDAVINDFNGQLINLYTVVRDKPAQFIRNLNQLQRNHNENEYYRIRNLFNRSLKHDHKTVASASYMLYLNKMGYNGLYRINSEGLFNVPSANRTECHLYDRDNIYEVSRQLNNAQIMNVDFEEACANAQPGDFVFFDSPYYNTFDTYQAGGFSKDDHIRLFNLFERLSNQGVNCLLTNSNEKFITNLYHNHHIRVVEVKRMINCDGKKRNSKEVIITNY